MNRGFFRLPKQTRPHEALNAEPGFASPAGRWVALALILGVAAIGLRIVSIRETLDNTLINAQLLKAAMRAAGGADSTAAADERPGSDSPSGLPARAMSEIAQNAGQTAAAEAWLIGGLADLTSAFLTQFELCLLYWNESEPERALEACRETKASAPYWLNQGYRADQRGDRVEALAYFRMAGAVDPTMVPAWHQLGHTLFALGRYEEAVSAYEQVIRLDDAAAVDVYNSLALAYLNLDNPPMARDVLNRGLALYPNERAYYLAMAEAFRAEDDRAAADGWYAQLLQRWPYDAYGWAARGEVALSDGRPQDAVAYYQAAINTEPQAAGYWVGLASAAAESGDVPLALEAYRQARALQPDNIAVLLSAGQFLVETQQLEEAKEIFGHILQLQPDNSDALARLAELEATPDH